MKAAILAGLLVLSPQSTTAHSPLIDSAPENGAVVTERPSSIAVTFENRIRLTRVRMTHDSRSPADLDLEGFKEFATQFELPLTDMESGSYQIELRGLSEDGHAMRATLEFQVE